MKGFRHLRFWAFWVKSQAISDRVVSVQFPDLQKQFKMRGRFRVQGFRV